MLFLVALPALVAALVEGRRAAVDRLMTALIWTAFGCAVVPLVWLIWVVLKNGLPAINAEFLTYSMRNVIGDEQGGIYHALIGTLLITVAATVISVPIGDPRPRSTWSSTASGRALARGDHVPGGRDDRHPVDRGRPVRAGAVRAALRAGVPDRASAARSRCRC